jgi:hypothetical protein
MNRTKTPNIAACVLAALATALATALAAPTARAGSVFVSRDSEIRASGASAAGEYRLSNSSSEAGTFTDGLLSDQAAPAQSAAQQHSLAEVNSAGLLSGASAEGAARASLDVGAADAFSDAETTFDLIFRVEDRAALFTFDVTLAAAGDATAGVSLFDPDLVDDPLLISAEVAGETRTVHESALLEPGVYSLAVWGFARGTVDESFSSYSVAVSLRDGQGGVVPMPLPAAVWAGLGGLSAVGLLMLRPHRRATA